MSNATKRSQATEEPAPIDWYDPQERDENAEAFTDEEQPSAGHSADEQFNDAELARARATLKNRSGVTPRIKALRKLARESSIGIKQRTIFLSAAELDEMRKPHEQMGLAKLFEAWCLNGNENWLNPIVELKPITENLGNFSGHARALKPFIFVLLQLARGGISPAEFVRYVLLPRMAFDHDWRRWRERHYWALNRIAEVLIAMRGKAPFAERYLGEGRTLTDIVLVKYVGKPLARFPTHVLEDEELMKKYQAAWRRLRLANPVFLLFLRTNVFPFLYRLSGKVDLVQLVPIVTYAAELEPRFDRAFPSHDTSSVQEVFSVSLYNDFEANMTARQKKGLTTFSLVREIKAYLRIIRTLIDSNAGIYLSGHFAALLRSVLDPDAAEALAQALPDVYDTGGMRAYRWHAQRLIHLEPEERRAFVEQIREHRGLHPAYPNRDPDQLFTPPELEAEQQDYERLASELKLGLPPNRPKRLQTLRDQVSEQNADRKPVIDSCVSELLHGKDRSWTDQRITLFDSLGPHLHELMIRSVISGIGRGFARQHLKAGSFAELFERYGAANRHSAVSVTRIAAVPERPFRDTGPPQNAKLRERVQFAMLRSLASTVLEHDDAPPLQEFIRLLNRRGQELDDALRDRREQEINKGESGNSRAVAALKAQRARIQAVFNHWDELSEVERFVTAIIASARVAERGDELERFAIAQFLNRYKNRGAVAPRLEYLKQDIAPERMTLRQLGYLINTLETMLAEARHDWDKPETVFPAGENLEAAAGPFATVRRGELTSETFETSARRLLGITQAEIERGSWRDLQDQLSGASSVPRTLVLSCGKSAVDAYFGDMSAGATSSEPDAITRAGLQIVRLGDRTSGRVFGSAVLAYSKAGVPSLKVERYFATYGFTILREQLQRWSRKQWLFTYFQYRLLLEQIAARTGLPVFLAGLGSPGIVSGCDELAELIVRYERWTEAPEARDAAVPPVYYSEPAFRRGLLIIDPRKGRGFTAEQSIANLKLS